MTTPPAQLSFALNNPGAPSTLYITADASANQLTLVIASNVEAWLTAGIMVPIEEAAAQTTGSLFYLDLSDLGLTEAEFKAIAIDGSDWVFAGYYSSASSMMLGFTPTKPLSLSGTSALSLSLGNFTLANQPAAPTAQLNVTYFRADGVTTGDIPMMGNFGVAVTYPADEHDQDLQMAIQASLSPDEVVNCQADAPSPNQPLPNNLTLRFSPGPAPAVINASADTRFTLTFIYADDANGFGAMMTPAQAQPPGFTVTAGTNASAWTITPSTGDESPSWTLSPPAGQPIIGTGVQSTVSFNMNGLVTNFQPGPTLVLVAYRNVPGCKDGTYSIVVEKVGHVEVENFVISPEQPVLENGFATVTVSWTAYYATKLTLNLTAAALPSGPQAAQPNIIDVTGSSSYTAQITDSTQFELVAEGQSPDNLVNNRYIARATAYIKTVIKMFNVDPQYIVEGSNPPTTCRISWEINAPPLTEVTVSSSTDGQIVASHESKDSVDRGLSQAQVLTLKAVPQCGYPTASAEFGIGTQPAITAFSVHPPKLSPAPGEYVTHCTATWEILGVEGTTVTLAFSNFGNTPIPVNGLSGSYAFDTFATDTVTLTATGPGGSPVARKSVAIKPAWSGLEV